MRIAVAGATGNIGARTVSFLEQGGTWSYPSAALLALPTQKSTATTTVTLTKTTQRSTPGTNSRGRLICLAHTA